MSGMTSRTALRVLGLAAVVFLGTLVTLSARQTNSPAQAVAIDPDDIGGVVTGPKGPEAGVWVIAETSDLPTKFARIVVTDDRAATSSLTCQRRSIRCGSGATASSTRRRPRRHLGSGWP